VKHVVLGRAVNFPEILTLWEETSGNFPDMWGTTVDLNENR